MINVINKTLRHGLAENQKDLNAFDQRANEPAVTYEALLRNSIIKMVYLFSG